MPTAALTGRALTCFGYRAIVHSAGRWANVHAADQPHHDVDVNDLHPCDSGVFSDVFPEGQDDLQEVGRG